MTDQMSESSKRKGIRFPWLTDGDESSSEEAGQPQNGIQPVESADAGQAAPQSAAPAAEPAPSEASGPFLQSMVDAMRRIAEQARDDAMAKLAAAVEERSADMRSTTELRAAELRDQADADLVRIGEWEQGEVQRIREEAAARVTERRTQLEAQLQANGAAVEGAMSSVASRIEAFEQRMAVFFADLADVHDPAAFAAAVKRMPSPPSLDEASTAPPITTTAVAPVRPSWPAEPETPVAPATAAVAEAVEAEPQAAVTELAEEPAAATALEAQPVEASVADAGPDVSTQIMVSGLNSFGAITQFKQSLERANGIRRVSLGLGSSGEFVFTATHAEGFDPTSAIRSFESAAQFRTEDGQLKVSVGANG